MYTHFLIIKLYKLIGSSAVRKKDKATEHQEFCSQMYNNYFITYISIYVHINYTQISIRKL